MNNLLIIGICLSAGLLASYIFKWLKIPQVVGHISIGVLLGISGFKLLDLDSIYQLEDLTLIALGFIGMMIGSELRWARLKRVGLSILAITFFETTCAALFVGVATYLFTQHALLSLLLGALAAATAPGGTTTVLQEYRTRGPLTNTLLGVIGADDAFAIVLYTIAFTTGKSWITASTASNMSHILIHVGWDIGLSILIGSLFSALFIMVMKQINDTDARQIFGLGFVFCCTGVAIWLGSSVILANMAMGICISNMRPHQAKPFFQILYKITPPIYIMFFILVGAKLNIFLVSSMGAIGGLYFICRILGKLSGAWIGSVLSRASTQVKQNLGLCLLSQAGVAIGLAISANKELEALSNIYNNPNLFFNNQNIGMVIINVITATTFIFQIIGPMFTKYGLKRAGEIKTNVR